MGITIRRYEQSININETFKVFVDDEYVVSINNGETLDLDIPHGEHKINLEVDGITMNSVEFTVNDEHMNFVCGSELHPKKGLLAALFIHRLSNFVYIKLDEDI